MLRNLVVKDYTLIDHLSIDFDKGLNVITGETGAGKSIVIDALTLVLGNRGSKGNIRNGKNKIVVQGLFEIAERPRLVNLCEEFGIPVEDGQLILTREVDLRGRNICRANGMMITVTQLKALGDELIDIHGQHEHQSLFKKENHRSLLDAFGGQESAKLLDVVADLAGQLRNLKNQIKALEINERELNREKETLAFEVQEIKAAHLALGEDERLEEEKAILTNQESLFENASQAYQILQGHEKQSILSQLGMLQGCIQEIAQIDKRFEKDSGMIDGFFSELESLSFSLRNYLDELEYNKNDLDQIEERLATIETLKRKYGFDIEEIFAYLSAISERLKNLGNRDENLKNYQDQMRVLIKKYDEIGQKLYNKRSSDASVLKKALEKELADLAMEQAQVEIQIEHDKRRLSPRGQDQVEILISVNPGIAPKALGKVASGGEISRIMLSLKSIFGRLDGIETMVFDEIDTGISGRTAQIVAEKIQHLSSVSLGRQIICITHLPQIAAMADAHFRVEKTRADDQVEVSFVALNDSGKKEELARMLGGAEVTKKTMEHAAEMLELSHKLKLEQKSKEDKILH
ncbi:MAG: repair protein RecN [Eubacteriaceae bacterium]|nr:repair protein RecN [Eubacteriaceae bacterium]MDK2937081.1 repair protein RecN [Eubacteriaceae bacterium]MDN5307674.1 repair protein RecN [Eubacteriaceae bacterium]